jgi:transcriptional regulator with XRE-family HTH domain
MATRCGGQDRISTKAKLADELVVLGTVLTEAREARRLKQGEVAARLGLPASYLSKIESGTRRLDVIEFIRIAEAIGNEPSALLAKVKSALADRQEYGG